MDCTIYGQWTEQELAVLDKDDLMVGLTDDEQNLLAAVFGAGYSHQWPEDDDISSGSIRRMVMLKDIRAFVDRWQTEIEAVAGDYLDTDEPLKTLQDMYARYAQAAVSWASSYVRYWLDNNEDKRPLLLINRVSVRPAAVVNYWRAWGTSPIPDDADYLADAVLAGDEVYLVTMPDGSIRITPVGQDSRSMWVAVYDADDAAAVCSALEAEDIYFGE